MKRKVYRSLDKPSSFFGIRGRYITWLGMVLGIIAVLALFVGSMTATFVGFIVFGAGAVGAYMYVISFQERVSDRQLEKMLDSKRMVSCITRNPGRVRTLFRHPENK